MTLDDDILISYALGQLTSAEEAEVEAQLESDPDAAATASGYLEALTELVMALPPEPLDVAGEAALLARVRSAGSKTTVIQDAPTHALPPVMTFPARPGPAELEPAELEESDPAPSQGRPRSSPYGWLSALAAAAVVALLYFTATMPFNQPFTPELQVAQLLRTYQAEPGAVSYPLAQNAEQTPEQPTGQPEPTRLGTLVRLAGGRVFVALDAPPAAEQVYQAWDIGQAPVSLGTFDGLSFLSEAPVAVGNTFGLTLEPPGGSDQPTSTPLTLLEVPNP